MLRISSNGFLSFFLLFFFVLASCGSDEVIIPEDILKPDKMTSIMVDIQLAESALMHMEQRGENAGVYKKKVFELVFEKHQTTREKFDSSLSYYSLNNLQQLDAIYAEVITQLSQKQSLINQ